ncbi:hypothetical protein NP493_2457g00000 [Ridgeia piscesae]|uniref:Uncharacterized protein n=1 Tax=Ridgeia piscesae TaxID=27915 RepID=A0AAD9JGV8_RIDPI|nr:hypothetical protein NP493_2457g00000 [Ridgeia piscesae]
MLDEEEHSVSGKGQYEVTQGQLKSPEELGDFWIDILDGTPPSSS